MPRPSHLHFALALLPLLLIPPPASALSPVTPVTPATTAVAADPLPVPAPDPAAGTATSDAQLALAAAGTELLFTMQETVSSKTHIRGDRFGLVLAEPLTVDGQVLMPAGTIAVGEVVHAAKTAMGGQPGELILAARYIDFAGRQLPLRGFQAGVGKSRVNASMATAIAAGVVGMLVRGKHVEIAAGSPIVAKLKTDVALPMLGPVTEGSVAPAPTVPADASTTESTVPSS